MTMYSPASIIALGIVLPLLGVTAVLLRFLVRLRLRPAKIGGDDYMIVLGAFFVCAMGANELVATYVGGLGRHTPETPSGKPIIDSRTRTTLKNIYAQDIQEKLAYGFIKMSVLLFYRRVFNLPNFRLATNIMLGIMAAWTVAFFVAEIFECGVHPQVQWNYKSSEEKNSTCVDNSFLLLWFAITDVIGDIAILCMPIRPISSLQKSLKEKLGLIGIFMLGGLSTAAGVVRLAFVSEAFTEKYGQSGDVLGQSTPPWVWTTVEASLGVVAACLPALAPLMRDAPGPRRLTDSLRNKFSYHSHKRQSIKLSPLNSDQDYSHHPGSDSTTKVVPLREEARKNGQILDSGSTLA